MATAAAQLEACSSLDAWSRAVPGVSCAALHAQLAAVAGACNTALSRSSSPEESQALFAALSPMLDPVVTVLAQ